MRSLKQFKDNLGCLSFELDSKDLVELEKISQFDLGFPGAFLSDDHVHQLIFGKTFDQLDNHRHWQGYA